jgi:hypothetical protein
MFIFTSCKKTEVTPIDPTDTNTYAKFSSIDSISTFYVSSENDSFKIPISVNLTSNTDRSISISYTSNTAVMDQQYSVNNTFVLSAGKQADSLTIQGIYAGFSSSSQIDTLKITIVSNADIKADKSHTSYYLILRKKCPSIDLNDLLGTYLNTNEVSSWNGAYGPYTTSITSVQNVTSTTGTIVVENIYDYGWPAVTFNLNWTNPQNPIAIVVAQNGLSDGAGTIYDVRPFQTGNLGSFSTCDNVLTLIMQVRIDGGNWDATPYVVNLAR